MFGNELDVYMYVEVQSDLVGLYILWQEAWLQPVLNTPTHEGWPV